MLLSNHSLAQSLSNFLYTCSHKFMLGFADIECREKDSSSGCQDLFLECLIKLCRSFENLHLSSFNVKSGSNLIQLVGEDTQGGRNRMAIVGTRVGGR